MADGDIVMFNRQPSLHRLSIMAHKVCTMSHLYSLTIFLLYRSKSTNIVPSSLTNVFAHPTMQILMATK